jgi:hypothetical protein
VLEDAGRVPLDTLCGGPSLGAPLRETLARLLLATNTSGPVGRAFFQSSGRVVGWAPVADPDFDEVRRVLRQVTEHRATPGAAP